jgi:Na+/H+ antiporter NhaD/arsenite permease-like protein
MYYAIIVIFILTYMLISLTNRINKTLMVLIGACLVVFLNVVPFQTLSHQIDLNVIFMLMGIMIIGDIIGQTGLFEWISIMLARKFKGSGLLTVMGVLCAVAVCSALYSSIATLILFVPIAILLAQILNLPVRPFLILLALFANLGGATTLIGDPCNMIVGSRAGVSYMQFIIHVAPAAAIIGIFWLCLVAIFRGRCFVAGTGSKQQIMKALPEKAIPDFPLLRRALLIGLLILAALIVSSYTRSEPGVILLFGAIIMGLACRLKMRNVLQKVDWPSIIFVGGLFVIIGSLEMQGGFDRIAQWMQTYTNGNLFAMTMLTLWGAALFSSAVDNIPLAIALTPLVGKISSAFPAEMNTNPLLWALVLGITLGSSISLLGSSGNYAMKRLAERNKYNIGVMVFSAYGLPFAISGLLIASLYLYIRYFMK